MNPKPKHVTRDRDYWFCLCGCGVSLRGMRAHAMYASNACKRRVQRRIASSRRQLQPLTRAS